MEQEKVITFNLSGRELSESRYNLHYLTEGLSLSKKLLEQSYLITVNKSKMTKNDREAFKIYIDEIRDGSFETDLYIFMQSVSGALISGYSGMNPKDIWNLLINAIKYLRGLFKANINKEKIKLDITNSPNAVVNINSNGATTTISTTQDVIDCARNIEPIIRNGLKMIDRTEAVTSVSLLEKDDTKNSVIFGVDDKELFKNEPILDDQVVEFIAEIEVANFNLINGKLKVIDPMASGLMNQDYNFTFIEPITEDSFRKSCSQTLNVRALKMLKFNTITIDNDVVSLKVISFK